ncbi:hypothetical protein [Spongiactinospora sp. 9N601]|uniref:hypothetical protein n=1 Tax=Spongiactinospora sp. 9N601 TaxID=3375149 RepID=UPI0037934E02
MLLFRDPLSEIRAARELFVHTEEVTLPLFDHDTVLLIAEWHYAGRGYNPGAALVAVSLTQSPAHRNGL